MPQRLRTRLILPALLLGVAVMLWAAPIAAAAPFSMTVSTAATSDMTLVSNDYLPTANGANLNIGDLLSALNSANLTVGDGGQITVESTISASAAFSNLTFNGPVASTGALTISTVGDQSYDGALSLGGNLTLTSGDGSLTLSSSVDGAGSLSMNAEGGTASLGGTVGATTALASLTVTGVAIDLAAAQIATSGRQTYEAPVTLDAGLTATSTGTGIAGDIEFFSTINGAHALSVQTGGAVYLEGSIGGTAEPTSLAVQPAAAIDLGAPSIATDGTQVYGAPVTLLTGVSAFSSASGAGGDITFDSAINGAQALEVGAPGTLDFAAAIGGTTPLTSLSIPLGGSTNLSGNVTTTGSQAYGLLALQNNVTFSAGASGTVSFNEAVSGAQVTISGGGTAVLAYPGNTYDGTVVTGGSTLSFGAHALDNTGQITLNDATLLWGPYSANTNDISAQLQPIGAGGGTLDTNGNDVTLADGFGGSGALIKSGAGTLTLGAASGAYGDQIVVHGGTVAVPSSAAVSTPVVVQSGGDLSCDGGTLSGGVSNQGGTATGAPAPPTNVSASLASRTASISFTPGAANCYPVSYTASSGALSFGPLSASPITAAGLSGGQAFAFTVTATNPIASSSSAPSNTVNTALAPTVTIASPVNNATYMQGQVVAASYACAEGSGGPGIASCSAPVASGAALDTQTLGSHSFTVTALSSDGYSATATATYEVVAAATPAPPAPPVNRFTVRQLKGKSSGLIEVSLATLSGPGTVKLTARPAGLPTFSVRKTAAKATLKFTVAVPAKVKAWLKRHHHKLAIRVSITYTPRGGKPRSVTRTIRL